MNDIPYDDQPFEMIPKFRGILNDHYHIIQDLNIIDDETEYQAERHILNVGGVAGSCQGKIVDITMDGGFMEGQLSLNDLSSMKEAEISGLCLNLGGVLGPLEEGWLSRCYK